MIPTRERGQALVFITLEGGEGAGKSTQLTILRQRLAASGHAAVTTREPGGSPKAERLRAAILHGRVRDLGPDAELIVFAAARADHLRETIRPALARGAVVICDRFIDSTRVYQGVVEGVPAATIGAMERVVLDGTMPDLTFILDLPAAEGLARATVRRSAQGDAPDRFESEGLAFHERVRQAFLAVARAEPDRCRVVDASRRPEAVADAIWAGVVERLPRSAASVR